MDDLIRLAKLIRQRNIPEREMSALIDRPAEIGHVGEYIASKIFHITLHESASHRGTDGYFSDGPLKGRSVNVKWYTRHEGLLDITPDALPDYYLVFTGPESGAASSRGQSRPWIIEKVFLFDAHVLVHELKRNNVRIGTATSVREHLWVEAEIYPVQRNHALRLSEEQRKLLMLFGPGCDG